MASPSTTSPNARLITRRQGLGLLAAAVPLTLVAACNSSQRASTPATTAVEQVPGPSLGQAVAADEEALIALYEAVIASLPEDGGSVRPLLLAIRDQHRQHRTALLADAASAGDAAPAPDPAPSFAPGDRALAALLEAERAAAKARIRACVAAEDPELVRVLAFIAASEASHVPALRALA